MKTEENERRPQNVITMHARVFIPCVRENMALDTRHIFISLKPVLAFQTLTLATLGKWTRTHERVFFLGKNCSWTLLPGLI